MENSINFLHPIDTIKSSTDGRLFHKIDGNWTETKNILYKSEYKLPTNDIGNDGDFYAKYYRKYNYILFSEDFTQNCWNKNHCTLNVEPTLNFPYNNPTKLSATNELSEHGLDYLFYNELRNTYTFSVYVRKNEIQHFQILLSDSKEKYGVRMNINLITNVASVEKFGVTDDIEDYKGNVEVCDNGCVRVWVSAKFKTTIILKAGLKMLNENMNNIFQPENETSGLFINGTQLVMSDEPEEYILSNGKYATQLVLKKLFRKVDGEWIETIGKIHYLIEEPTESIGVNDDLACLDAIITLNPMVHFGSSETVGRWDRPVGTMYYNPYQDKWFVKTKRGEYSLMFKEPRPNYYGAAIAMSLNQQVYQTANRYGAVRHMKGFNTGGNRNFWIRNTGKTRI
jgi:hypothetical protein